MNATRRRLLGVVALVALAAAAVGTLQRLPNATEPTVSAAPGTATTAQPTTTIPANSLEFSVAASNDGTLDVYEQHPEGVALSNGNAEEWVNLPSAEEAVRPEIPRHNFASAGVRRTDEGWNYDNPTYFGNDLHMMVLAEEDGWLEVVLPARPNGQTGWVRADDVEISNHDAVIEISLGERMLTAWKDGEELLETDVVVGTEATPTPTGTFYLTEKVPQPGGGGAYGPWVLSTNGYSEAMDLFDSGLPVIALHGTNAPDLLGSAASNGCIRLPNEAITTLAEELPEGTPIQIVD